MNRQHQHILAAFAARIRQSLPTAALWAFGSRVRGDATPESDFDICVVVDRLDRSAREMIRQAAWEIGFANNMVITTVKYSARCFPAWAGVRQPLGKDGSEGRRAGMTDELKALSVRAYIHQFLAP